MDTIELIVMLLIVVALIGIMIYFVYTYMQDKQSTDTQITSLTSRVSGETSNRLSNIKYVVDQLNGVTGDISTTFASSNTAIFGSIANISSNMTNLSCNLALNTSNSKSFITIGTKQLSLFDLPGTAGNVDINLIQHVNAMAGLTGSNLTPAGNSVKFCYGPDTTNCIQFPDKAGNTYMTAPPKGNIVLNSATTTNGTFSVGSDMYVNGKITTSNVVYVCPPSATDATSCSAVSADAKGNLSITPASGNAVVINGNVQITGSLTNSNNVAYKTE